MKKFSTIITAIPVYGGVHINNAPLRFVGPTIIASTKEEAQRYCEEFGLGYCQVSDEDVTPFPNRSGEFVAYPYYEVSRYSPTDSQ